MAATKWGELQADAHHAGMAAWGDRWDRTVKTSTLYPAPAAELVELEGGALAIRHNAEWNPRQAEPDGLLEGFCRLSEGEPEDVLRFVRRFGPLNLCEHGLRVGHMPPGLDQGVCLVAMEVEPLYLWHFWSRRARAALAIAARLHRGKPGREDDWEIVGHPADHERGTTVEVERHVLGHRVDFWLHMTGARPVLRWDEGWERPTIKIGSDGLWQNLARELALTVARLDGLAVCDGCGNPYTPKRKPRPDRRNFCESCREDGVPARLRMRDRRERERGESDD